MSEVKTYTQGDVKDLYESYMTLKPFAFVDKEDYEALKAERDKLEAARQQNVEIKRLMFEKITTLTNHLRVAKEALIDVSNATGASGIAGCKMLASKALTQIETLTKKESSSESS